MVPPDHKGGRGMSSGEIDKDTIRLVRTFNRQLIRKLRLLNRNLSETGLNVTQGDILYSDKQMGYSKGKGMFFNFC